MQALTTASKRSQDTTVSIVMGCSDRNAIGHDNHRRNIETELSPTIFSGGEPRTKFWSSNQLQILENKVWRIHPAQICEAWFSANAYSVSRGRSVHGLRKGYSNFIALEAKFPQSIDIRDPSRACQFQCGRLQNRNLPITGYQTWASVKKESASSRIASVDASGWPSPSVLIFGAGLCHATRPAP